MRSWKFGIGLLISIVFLAVALHGLDLEHFWQTLRGATYWWLLPSIGVYFVAVLLRTWRWQYMLGPVKRVPLTRLFPVVVIGYMGNNVYPARAGEVLRSFVLRRTERIPISTSLMTVVLERLFDGLVMLLFVLATLPFAPLPPIYRTVVLFFSALFGIALLLFLGVAAYPQRVSWIYTWGVDHLIPPRLRPMVHSLFDRFIEGLQSLRSPRDVALIFLSSALIWLTETAKYWFVMQAFPFSVSFPVLMLMTAVVNLFTTIPSTPGHIGTFDAPGIAVLTSFGVDHAIATGYTLVLHVALWLPITLLGVYYMLHHSLSWGDLRQASRPTDSATGSSTPQTPSTESAHLSEVDHDDIATRVAP